MNRRRFAFWIGMGLFGMSERLNAASLDRLAARVMHSAEPAAPVPPASLAETVGGDMPVHWQATHNGSWRWLQREHYVDGQWRLTGMTRPVNRKTGEQFAEVEGYLDDSEAPEAFLDLTATGESLSEYVSAEGYCEDAPPSSASLSSEELEEGIPASEDEPGPDAASYRRKRHGRPPSRWLRSLTAAELSVWLATLEPPQAGVSGMTFLTHLTRDHGFRPEVVEPLTDEEQRKLHGAAHHGY